MVIQTSRPSRAGGHTQPRASIVALLGVKTSSAAPPTPITAAGTAAHFCGWSVKNTDSASRSAHPAAKPRSTSASMTGSVPPADTTTPAAAAASPTNRPRATTTRIGHRVCRRWADGSAGPAVMGGVVVGSDSGSLWWVVVTGGRTTVS